jgi:hypothetical protein
MSHIRVLICRVDDPSTDTMTELASFDLPAAEWDLVDAELTARYRQAFPPSSRRRRRA